MIMNSLPRRTLIIAVSATIVASRAGAVEQGSERTAEALIAEAINRGRKKLAPELPPLEGDPVLDQIARERSFDMAHGAPFDHRDEHGGYPAIEKMRARYTRYGAMGENIVMDFDPAGRAFDPHVFAGRAVKSWFDSDEHRDNILTAAFSRAGTGVAFSRTTAYATQVFWGAPAKRGERRS